jgi:hypothetical protein
LASREVLRRFVFLGVASLVLALVPRASVGASAFESVRVAPQKVAAMGAVSAPVVSIQPRRGPFDPARVVIRGPRVGSATKVKFGVHSGSRLKRLSPRRIAVWTPEVYKIQRVPVRVLGRSGRVIGRTSYKYVDAPARPSRIDAITPASTSVAGGEAITVTGRNLDQVRAIDLGPSRVRDFSASTPTTLTFEAPAGLAGPVDVFALTEDGAPRPTDLTFTYRLPPPVSEADVTPADETVALDPLLVSEVTQTLDPAGWVVTTSEPPPASGAKVYLPPSSHASSTGLTGTVTSAVADGASTRLTVEPSSLDDVFDEVDVRYSRTFEDLGAMESRSPVSVSRSAGAWKNIAARFLDCKSTRGDDVAISGELSIDFLNLNPHIELRFKPFQLPYVAAWLSYELRVATTLSADVAAECRLSALFRNTHAVRLITPTGLSVTLLPDIRVGISAGGAISYGQTSFRTIGFTSKDGGGFRTINEGRADPATIEADTHVEASVFAGAEVRFGFLDTIGVGISVGLNLEASGSTRTGPIRYCVDFKIALKGDIHAFLNYWIGEENIHFPSVSISWGLKEKCWPISPESIPKELLTAVNDARDGYRWCGSVRYPPATPLFLDARLNRASQKYAVRMADEGFFAHYAPDGSTPGSRAAAEGFTDAVGENLAWGYPSVRDVVDAWMNSPGHCANIMSADGLVGFGLQGPYWAMLARHDPGEDTDTGPSPGTAGCPPWYEP